MSEGLPGLPGPRLTHLTEGYWRAAGEGRLVIQRCGDCRAHRHPPAAACYRCQSQAWAWDEVSGRGAVFTYTWVHHPVHPALADLGVYNVAVVELEDTEGDPVRILSRVLDVSEDELEIGMPVDVDFDTVEEGIGLPVFRRRASRTGG